jgi:hypothetical protein
MSLYHHPLFVRTRTRYLRVDNTKDVELSRFYAIR